MTTVFAEPVQAPAWIGQRRRRRRRLLVVALILAGVMVVSGVMWRQYQPLQPGGGFGGGDGRLGEGNPFHEAATMVNGVLGHHTDLVFSLYNSGSRAVSIDRIVLPDLLALDGMSDAGVGRSVVRLPDRIGPHRQAIYALHVRVLQCINSGGTSGFDRVTVHFHALGLARTASIPIGGGVALVGGTQPCPDSSP